MKKDVLKYKDIGKRIRELRENRSLTIRELAKLSSIDEASISNIERGTKRLGLYTLVLLSSALETNVDYILFGNTDYPYSRHLSKEEDIFLNDVLLSLRKNFSNKKEEEEKERTTEEIKKDNHVHTLLEISNYIHILMNNFLLENRIYKNISEDRKKKLDNILKYIYLTISNILPTGIGFHIGVIFEKEKVKINNGFYFKNQDSSIIAIEENTMKYIYVQDDKMLLHGISKYLENTRI